jgi:signal transduction histidine kinase
MYPNYKELLENLLHELAPLNAAIRSHAETVSVMASKRQDWNGVKDHAESLLENTFLFNTHVDMVNFHLNPGFFTTQKPAKRDLYGKFKKSRISFQRIAKNKNITLNLEGAPSQLIDSYFVIDTLPNLLLDNALKYATRSSEVWIEIEDEGDTVQVKVSNEGPHITESEIDSLFDRGFRSEEATKTNTQGSGYGMSFIKYICDIHNAKLKVESAPNTYSLSGVMYSTFTVEITFQKSLQEAFV